MSTLKRFFINASTMSIVSVFLRIVGLYFSVWLSRTLGEEGMGIYSLVSSAYRLGITFASGGISFAATRLIAEELENKNPREALRVAEKCIFYSFALGTLVSIFFFSCSNYLGRELLGDVRCIISIKIMAISLPFLVMTSIINAYFTGVRHLTKPAFCMLLEQGIRLGVTMALLADFDGKNLEYGCMAVIVGGVIAEIFSFVFSFIFYEKDKKELNTGVHKKTRLGKRISKIAIPVAISSYIRTGLLTVEHMMIPRGLLKYGENSSRALSTYGVISGMVFPVLFFPSAFLYAVSDLVVPEFSACLASGDAKRTKKLANKVMQLTSFFSVGVAGVLFGYADELGRVLYRNDDVGKYLKLLAPLVIVMFFDHLADAILKGLDKQLSVVGFNLIDSFMSLALVWILVPHFGIYGYIFVVWFGEVINCIMSSVSFVKTTKVKIRTLNWFVNPAIAISAALIIVKKLLLAIHGQVGHTFIALVVAIIITLLVYSLIMRVIGCITLHDYRNLCLAFAKKERKP